MKTFVLLFSVLRIGFAIQNKDIYSLGPNDLDLVEGIADAGSGMAKAQAQGLLNAVYEADSRILPKSPQGGGGGLPIIALPATNGNVAYSQRLETDQIVAFPNPAKDIVKFRYTLSQDSGTAWLTVFDVNGRTVANLQLHGKNNMVEWQTNGLSSGVYYYKMTQSGGSDITRKLIIIK